MRDLLFLAHRIPYPPNKGDKIATFHHLQELSAHFRIHLGAFIDDPEDLIHVETLKGLCASVYLPRLYPSLGQIRGLPRTLRGAPLSIARYEHTRFKLWVNKTLAQYKIQQVYAYSSAMGTYGLIPAKYPIYRLMYMSDVDSEKWRQYAAHARGPMRWVYIREYRRLKVEEECQVRAYDVTVFVTEEEAALFSLRHPQLAAKIQVIGNGVDLDYFNPERIYPDPFDIPGPAVVFTGAMDYQANVDGVVWFAREVWPRVLRVLPDARFVIVGRRPVAAVKALAHLPRVEVTGTVPDVRPYLAHADVVCAPLRVARGVQNKVLEALAMGCPVVATTAAWEGLADFEPLLGARVDDAADFAQALLHQLQSDSIQASVARRRWVGKRFSWQRSGERLLELFDAPGEQAFTRHRETG